MSVTVASSEEVFSWLKLIKTYLQPIISHERPNDSAILSKEDITKRVTLKWFWKISQMKKYLFLDGLYTNRLSVIILTYNKALKFSYKFLLLIYPNRRLKSSIFIWMGLAYHTKQCPACPVRLTWNGKQVVVRCFNSNFIMHYFMVLGATMFISVQHQLLQRCPWCSR